MNPPLTAVPTQSPVPQTTTPVVTLKTIINTSQVVSYPSRYSLRNGRPAVLAWDSANIITLQLLADTQPLFQCPATDIKKFLYMTDHTTITLRDGRKFMIGFNKNYLSKLQDTLVISAMDDEIGKVMGSIMGPAAPLGSEIAGLSEHIGMWRTNIKNDAANGSTWWTQAFQGQGVSAQRLTSSKVILFTILGLLGLFFVSSVIIAIATALTK